MYQGQGPKGNKKAQLRQAGLGATALALFKSNGLAGLLLFAALCAGSVPAHLNLGG